LRDAGLDPDPKSTSKLKKSFRSYNTVPIYIFKLKGTIHIGDLGENAKAKERRKRERIKKCKEIKLKRKSCQRMECKNKCTFTGNVDSSLRFCFGEVNYNRGKRGWGIDQNKNSSPRSIVIFIFYLK
jgi:hypothetical protein